MPSILIVDDDADLSAIVARYLESEGFAVERAASAEEAYDVLATRAFDLVLLDINLPGDDGFAACAALRRASDVPIVMLTSSDNEFDEVMSMNLGADDYVTKPYNPAVLLARIQSVLRRAARTEPPSRIEHKGVVLDVARSRVEYEGRGVELTRNEFRVLHLLMENKGAIISRQELMMELWQSDAFIDDNTLTVNVNRLRKSLASIGVPDGFLATRRGQGYLV